MGPIRIRVHLTGHQEMGVEAAGYGRRVRNRGPLRHMLKKLGLVLVWVEKGKGEGNL